MQEALSFRGSLPPPDPGSAPPPRSRTPGSPCVRWRC